MYVGNASTKCAAILRRQHCEILQDRGYRLRAAEFFKLDQRAPSSAAPPASLIAFCSGVHSVAEMCRIERFRQADVSASNFAYRREPSLQQTGSRRGEKQLRIGWIPGVATSRRGCELSAPTAPCAAAEPDVDRSSKCTTIADPSAVRAPVPIPVIRWQCIAEYCRRSRGQYAMNCSYNSRMTRCGVTFTRLDRLVWRRHPIALPDGVIHCTLVWSPCVAGNRLIPIRAMRTLLLRHDIPRR